MEAIALALIPVTFVVLLLVERAFPARPLPKVRGWALKGFVFFVIMGLANVLIPAAVAELLGGRTILDLGGIGTIGGAVVAFLVADFVIYCVHRLEHNVPFLWRWTHQMHHSAERIDVMGANYFHPLDLVTLGGSSTIATALLGITPDAAALAGLVAFFAQTFQHMNVRTPQWIGWIIQRPEAHSIHHARGIHAYNYGTFMLWDIMFGTFRNPRTFSDQPQGFWDGASAKVGAMLMGRDVSNEMGRA